MDKIILHIDMNSYFASVEQQANPFLRGKPIGITGKHQKRSIVATASIQAKALGVKTAMSTWEAKKICPNIILWPGDPEKYAHIMHRFNRIYHDFTDQVEEFSVDESFLDITAVAQDYFGAVFVAQAIRERLRRECGEYITASIGIAPNRLMAKLASESVKPNGLTIVRPHEILDLLDRSHLEDLCGIGPRIAQRLENLGIFTFKQLREFPIEKLMREFYQYGVWLHHAALGFKCEALQNLQKRPLQKCGFSSCGRPSTPFNLPLVGFMGLDSPRNENPSLFQRSQKNETAEPKSYGHSYTLPFDTHNPILLKRYLLGLADKVAWRLRRDGVMAHRLSVCVRFGDFSSWTQQHTSSEPTADGLVLFQVAWNLMKKISVSDEQPVRLVGLCASALVKTQKQSSLFQKERNMQKVLSSLDQLQRRYGDATWKRASTLPVVFQSRSSGFHFDHEL